MSRLRVESFTISLDGFGAGPDQSLEEPLGAGGHALDAWALTTRTFQQRIFGSDGGATGVDDDFAQRGFTDIGAWILGRNMFGPMRGPWPDLSWQGWWGSDPPYHVPVFVLTHHPRPRLEMEGRTVFTFVDAEVHAALAMARQAANGRDVRLGGGPNVVRQCLRAGLVDEMHVAIAPVLLGRGETLLGDLDLPALGYRCVQHVPTPNATHVVLAKADPAA